jgi:hypothetical protein
MKKLAASAITSIGFLSKAAVAYAATQIPISIPTPSSGINPNADPGKVISNAITIVFVIAIIAVLFMLIIGAFQWITSGGEKESVGKARGRITHALIGLAVLALAFLLVKLVGSVVNVNLLQLQLPSLDFGA